MQIYRNGFINSTFSANFVPIQLQKLDSLKYGESPILLITPPPPPPPITCQVTYLPLTSYGISWATFPYSESSPPTLYISSHILFSLNSLYFLPYPPFRYILYISFHIPFSLNSLYFLPYPLFAILYIFPSISRLSSFIFPPISPSHTLFSLNWLTPTFLRLFFITELTHHHDRTPSPWLNQEWLKLTERMTLCKLAFLQQCLIKCSIHIQAVGFFQVFSSPCSRLV